MSTEENKALVYRLMEEGLNQNQTRVFDELVAQNYVNYSFPAPAPGVEGYKQVMMSRSHSARIQCLSETTLILCPLIPRV